MIVPTFNRQDLLEKTLGAIGRSERHRDDYEVIVVDDGSSDETFAVARRFANEHGNLKYVYQPDKGFRAARARNLGAAVAEGEIFIFIDCGVLLDSNCIGAHIQTHGTNSDRVVVGYVYGFANTDEGSDALLTVIDPGDVTGSIGRMGGREEFLDIREKCYRLCNSDISRLPAPWAIAWTCNVSLPRRVFAAIGGFDEAYRSWGAEDLDFALSAFQSGARFMLNRGAAGIHHPHEKSFHHNTESSRRNKAYLHEKYKLPETELLAVTQSIDLNQALLARAERSPSDENSSFDG